MAKYDQGGGCPCGLYKECISGCEYAHLTREIYKCGPDDDYYLYNKKEKNMNSDNNDFGFTMVNDEDITKSVPKDNRAQQLRDMVMPLLNNMKLNPEKDYIQWKGNERVKQINAFIKKMNNLVDG